MSRLGKMPSWQKWFVNFGMLTCSLTGMMYLAGHEFKIQRSIFGTHHILAMHGVAAILATLALGSLLPSHLKAGLKSRRNWLSGFCQLSFLAALIITGLLLYYGSEPVREIAVNAHWIFGLLFFVIFLIHIPSGLKKQTRR